MRQIPALAKRLIRDTRAATAVEYGLILALVFLAMAGALGTVADKTIGMWDYVSDEIVTAS
jgi:pilus assembly protein Flp/PilA